MQAIASAVHSGPEGEDAIIDALLNGRVRSQAALAGALGESSGEQGTEVLRRVCRENSNQHDLRGVALLALAKRCGADATGDLLDAMEVPSGDIKSWAVIGLAGAGTDLAWNRVFEYLRNILRQPPKIGSDTPTVLFAVAYLGQFLDRDDRRQRLSEAIRSNWSRLGVEEKSWLHRHWRDVGPDESMGSGVPDPTELRAWARDKMFGRIY
jgi:hypothetical protein